MHRRDLLVGGAASSAALLAATRPGRCGAARQATARATAERQDVRPASASTRRTPLTFKPGGLTGISEKMITSHHDKNYAGCGEEPQQGRDRPRGAAGDAPWLPRRGTAREAADLRQLDGPARALLRQPSAARQANRARSRRGWAPSSCAAAWEAQVRATRDRARWCSGWVVVGLSLHDCSLVIASSGNHTQAPRVRRAAPGARHVRARVRDRLRCRSTARRTSTRSGRISRGTPSRLATNRAMKANRRARLIMAS